MILYVIFYLRKIFDTNLKSIQLNGMLAIRFFYHFLFIDIQYMKNNILNVKIKIVCMRNINL